MSALDVKQAKQALAWRLGHWGVELDADGKAASFIDDLVSQGWQMAPDRESRPRPPKVGEQCPTCSRTMHAPDPACGEPTWRPSAPAADPQPHIARLRALRDSRLADLCAHHVPTTNCAECRKPAPDHQPAEEPRSNT